MTEIVYFSMGLITGAVLALVVYFRVDKADMGHEETKGNKADSERLNSERKAREQWLKEQNRQHDNLMSYTGKEQKKA